jgi:hypothetical protein
MSSVLSIAFSTDEDLKFLFYLSEEIFEMIIVRHLVYDEYCVVTSLTIKIRIFSAFQ